MKAFYHKNNETFLDEEHKKRQVTEIEFLKGDEQYTNKVDMAFDALFEGAQSDPEYLENVSIDIFISINKWHFRHRI